MKKLIVFLALLLSVSVFAQTAPIKVAISGSDTLGGVMTDAIITAGLNQKITYVGGGSGVGEKALSNGEISITAMSREFKPEVLTLAQTNGIVPVAHVVGLDGIAALVNKSNNLPSLDFQTLAKIFTCQITTWNQVPGSNQSGTIAVYRRDDKSGTTDTFKTLVGIKDIGPCAIVLAETADIADRTALEVNAIGYAGLSGLKEGNRALALTAKVGVAPVEPNTTTIRNNNYPLARKLYIYEASGKKSPEGVQADLLDYILDRSFLDPILQDHDFITLD